MLLVVLMLVYGIKCKGGGTEGWLDINACNSLQGAAAVYVTLGHIHDEVPFLSPFVWILYPSNSALILTNGLFFFISGYGLWESRKSKSNYMSGWSFLNRLVKLGIPAYMAYVGYYPIRRIVLCEKISFVRHMFLDGVFSWFYYNGPVWFIIVLFFLYLIFWTVYRTGSMAVGNVILLSCMMVWTVIAVNTGRGVVWYASTFCFALGIFVSQYRKKFLQHMDTYYRQILLSGSVLFAVVFAAYRQVWVGLGVKSAVYGNLSALLFCILCSLVLYRYTLGNRITRSLGIVSYEIYLINTMALKVISDWNMDDVLKIYIIVLVTVVSAVILHWADAVVIQALLKFLDTCGVRTLLRG